MNRPKTCFLLFVALIAALAPFQSAINPYYFNILISIGINIILGVGLNLVTGYTGQFSLGHAGFMAVGAYLSGSVTVFLAPRWLPALGGGAAGETALFLLALIAGGLGAGLAGLAVGVPSLRLKGDYLAIVTLGFAEIIRVILQNMEIVGGPRGLSIPIRPTGLFGTYLAAALTVYVVVLLVHSTYGRGFLTVRDDEIAAEAMGINSTKYKVIAFVVAAFFAGIAGGLYAHFIQFITPEGFGYLKSVDIVVIVILGGMGNTPGVILAAILLTILPEGLRVMSGWEFLPDAVRGIVKNRMILYSLLLIILMLTRPQGLFSSGGKWTQKWRAMKRRGRA
ncbi:MAG: branched-chain amino acid ABC transporter permease [Chthoniobacteraceae bacterium]|nr:branched-chain amino acid ABC transporter permease [Chthoniobacteraceae bacterium]